MSVGTKNGVTRIEVLEAVKTLDTYAEISDWVGVCVGCVRYHLDILREQGAVKRTGKKPVMWTITRRGRRRLGYAAMTNRLGATT